MLNSIKHTFAGAGLVAMATVGPLTGNAIADQPRAINFSAEDKLPALAQAGNFGMKANNVGIMIYYGHSNGSSADEVGEYIVGQLEQRAQAKGQYINADYFVKSLPTREGIVVGYHAAGLGVEAKDIRDAITVDTFDEVIQLRATGNKVLELATLDK